MLGPMPKPRAYPEGVLRGKGVAALVVLLTVWVGSAHAQSDEPPPAGRPEDFSGIVGTFAIFARTSPTELQVLDSSTLTIKITETSGKFQGRFAPRRSALRVFPPSLARDFYLDALPDVPQSAPHTWEFAYRLKPKHAKVQSIPALKLSYYDPEFGKYQVAYSRSIPLIVRPRAPLQPPAESKAVHVPEHLYKLATGVKVLSREGSSVGYSLPLLALLLLVPPAGCALWYAIWQRLYPNAARRARLQRSQAARRALERLHALRRDPGAAESAAVVADYLRHRLDLASAEPTPNETLFHLRRAHVSMPVAVRVGDFFRSSDAVRFAPEAKLDRSQFVIEAEEIIHAVEAEPCLSRRS
jgi:hypothetical protein